MGAGLGENLVPAVDVVADQVFHLDRLAQPGGGERPAGDRADVLLELRDRGAVLGPMARIVDPGRDLVGDEAFAAASRTRKSSTASTPTWSSAWATWAPRARARRSVSGEIAAGTRVRFRMWFRGGFRRLSKASTAPSSPRARITEHSSANGTKPSRIAGARPIAS